MSNKENKVKFGLSNVHIAKLIEENGKITYSKPFPMPGAVALTPEPEGETTPFYADNIKYYIANSNQGYSGDLELAMLIRQFFTEILGQEEDKNGALFETSDDVTARFALMGEIEGDVKKRRFIYFDCTATRPSTEMQTVEESKEPQTDTVPITMSPRSTDRAVKAVIEPNEKNQEIYDTFFERVYEKDAELPPEITELTVTPVSELKAPVEAGTKVADLKATGGTEPYTFTLKEGEKDNAEFQINNTEVQAKQKIDSEATKNITVIVTDKNFMTKEQNAQISVGASEAV